MANLATSTWSELGHCDVVLIPLGSTEQHGPHLPFITDTAIAVAVAEHLAAVLEANSVRVMVAPAIPVGASGEHQDFPGTVSIGNDALKSVVIELARSVKTWAPRLVFVNGHGGNAPALAEAVQQLQAEDHRVMWVACGIPGQDAHAGREETSLMLHISPEQVNMAVAEPGSQEKLADLMPALMSSGVRAVSPNGVLGNPLGASAEEGQQLLQEIVTRVHAQIDPFVGQN